MISNTWVHEIESKVFTIIKKEVSEKLATKFPDLNFTTSSRNTSADPKFPCVYIHELPGAELGTDFENDTVNAVRSTIQVDVYSGTTQNDAKVVMEAVFDVFHNRLKYIGNTMPSNDNTNAIYRRTARFQRVICNCDTLL